MKLYERAHADGNPDWSEGTGFGAMWDHVSDQLRFHKGNRFVITDRNTGEQGPDRRFSELEDLVRRHVEASDHVIEIRANADKFAMIVRQVPAPAIDLGQVLLKDLLSLEGMPYLLDTMPTSQGKGTSDCSGLTKWGLERRGVDNIPHNAAQQHALFGHRAGFVTIPKSSMDPGDLVFIDQLRHVATYYGMYRGHPCVVDTEPHDTGAPWGGMLGTGVRIRPMDGNYYCARVVSVGRIVEINGKP